MEQLVLLEKEIQESNAELSKINQSYDKQVREEENLARGYFSNSLMRTIISYIFVCHLVGVMR